MDKKAKIAELRGRLDALRTGSEVTPLVEKLINDEISSLRENLKSSPTIKAYESSLNKFSEFKQSAGAETKAIKELIAKAGKDTDDKMSQLTSDFEDKLIELMTELKASEINNDETGTAKVEGVLGKFTEYQTAFAKEKQDLLTKDALIQSAVDGLRQDFERLSKRLEASKEAELEKRDDTLQDHITETQLYAESIARELEELRKSFNTRIVNIQGHGGGNANRNIQLGGSSLLTRYTDINFIAGSNMGIAAAIDDVNKRTNLTFYSTGGGVSSTSGITRATSVITSDTTGGSTAAKDYVYLAATGLRFTLPTAVANNNLYTVKNASNSSVLVNTTGGETIDGSTSALMPEAYESLDFISDNINWNVV